MNNTWIDFQNIVIPKINGGLNDYVKTTKEGALFFPTGEKFKKYIAKLTCAYFHVELKSEKMFSKFQKEKLGLYKYTEEYVFLLFKMLDKHELNRFNELYMLPYKSHHDIISKLRDSCCVVFTDEISTMRNDEYGMYNLHRTTEDLFSKTASVWISRFYRDCKNIDDLILNEISKNTNDFKDINKADFLLLSRVLKYRYAPHLFSHELGSVFAFDFKTHIKYYYVNHERYKLLLNKIVMNKINIKPVIGPDDKKNKKGRKR